MDKPLNWHSLPPDEVVEKLKSNLRHGLSSEDVSDRLRQYGPNELPEPQKRTLFSIFLHQFLSPLIYLLVVAEGIAFFIGEARDSLVILFVLLVNALIGAYRQNNEACRKGVGRMQSQGRAGWCSPQ